jgi:hypothetical protein
MPAGAGGTGYVPTFRAVSPAILAGQTEHQRNPLADTIASMETMDAVRRAIGR